jgi:hypothetical protein
VIAREAGVSRALIIAYRKRLGIPPYEGYKFGNVGNPVSLRRTSVGGAEPRSRPPSAFRGRRSQLDPYLDVLGKVPDAEVAAMAGVTPENVRTYRGRRGIPALWQARRSARENAEERPDLESAPERTAYLVNVDRSGAAAGYAIIANDFADAARVAVELVARHHPGSAIKAIQRIGSLLE